MKKKITTIKNKRLVEGEENLLTKNEILVETKGDTITLKERDDSGKIKQLSGSSGSSSSNSKGLYCYKRVLRRQHTDITDIFYSVTRGLSTFSFIITSFIPYIAVDPNELDISPALLPISQFHDDDRYIAYIIFDTSLVNNVCFRVLGDSYPGDEVIDQIFNRTVNKSVEEILDYIAELGEPKALLLKKEFLKEYTQIDNLDEEYKEIVKNAFKNNIG